MAAKSDFAQKLLNDLRVRKERMAAAQNSSRQSTQTSRVVHGNTGQTSKGARQINAIQSAGSRTGKTSRSNGSSRSINIQESSNQIVLYGNGQNSRQVRDLSMAIAFAFENSGNLSNIGASTTNPLVNFFNRFGRRSLDGQKMDITTFDDRSLSTGQFPTVSNIHITEVSKGVQKLNQILRACSNGFSFDRNSIQVGKDLLKGAIDLEESLRVLVNLQEASQYANGAQKKSHLKLLEEDEDEDDENAKIADQWKLDRPRFSFDKPISNTKVVSHKNPTGYVQDLSLSTQVKQNNNSSSLQSTQEKKRRISNVIAQLMGLEELPHNEDSILKKNDLKEKQGKVSSKNTTTKSILTNNTPPIRDSRLHLKTENLRETRDGSSKMVNSERNQPRKDLKIVPSPELATIKINNQQSHTIAANQVNGHQISEDSQRKQNPTADKQSKVIEREIKMLVSNTELQQKAQNSKTPKTEDKTHNRIGYQLSANSLEKRNADKDLPRNQQKPQDQRVLLQEQALKRPEHSEDKHRTEQNVQQFQKQNLMAKNPAHKVESIVPSKSKKNTAINSQKKLSRDKSVPGNGRSMKPTEKGPMKDPPKRRHQDVVPIIDNSQQTAVNKENIKKEDQIQLDKEKESRNPVLTKEKPIEVLATQKTAIPRKVQKGEIPQKIDVLMSRRNAAANNHLTKSIKQPANMLKDLKQQMHNKNASIDAIALNSEKISDYLQTVEQPHAQELKQCDQSIEDHEESTKLYNLSQHKDKQCPASEKHEQLTEPEKNLKEIVIKSHTFLSTAEALFKLNIPLSFLHAGEQDYEVAENKLVLNCAYEVMKRKAMRNEITYHPYTKTTKIRSLDDLIKQLCKDLEMLKFYGGHGSDECDVAASLYEMLDKDINDKDPDVNSMWDFEWSNMMSLFTEKDDVVRDVERYMLNSLLDEITDDLLLVIVSV
ncbi:hypothetical protein DH2020_048457 [Rehmannia glutinosa]|uniref:DUF3741 domain-containing protein n=1 Tax=Rehmannia glutinosa TaxID=99300 RepID=A0ABR0U5L4_REHGL